MQPPVRRPVALTKAFALSLLLGLSSGGGALIHAQTTGATAAATAGDRRIALEGAANFRDLGGYPTVDGRHVRWKKIYRSGELSRLTTADYERLSQLGIAVVCDFRRDSERNAAPTKWQGANAPAILNVPGDQKEREPAAGGAGAGSPQTTLSPLLMAAYPEYPTTMAPAFRSVIQQILTRDGAVLYHCTAGKDRTGTFSAMLLTMLGVPRDVVMQDYLLSNQFVATPARIEAAVARGASRESVTALLGVDRTYLELTFHTIEKDFGSFDEYRRKGLGVSDADLAILRAKLLE